MSSNLRSLLTATTVIFTAATIVACGDDEPTQPVIPNPVITSISPSGKFQGEPPFSLAVSGSDFVASGRDPVLLWDGTPRDTRRIDDSGLWADITAVDLSVPGEAEIQVIVFTESGDTVRSNRENFVVLPAPVAMTIAPSDSILAVGSSILLRATARLADGSVAAARELSIWSVDELRVARVSNESGTKGRLTGVSSGATRVYASLFGIRAVSRVVVGSLTAIEIDPQDPVLTVGDLLQLTASGRFADGSDADLTSVVDWSSSNPGIAAFSGDVGASGQLTALAKGTSTVSATLAGVGASTVITVEIP